MEDSQLGDTSRPYIVPSVSRRLDSKALLSRARALTGAQHSGQAGLLLSTSSHGRGHVGRMDLDFAKMGELKKDCRKVDRSRAAGFFC